MQQESPEQARVFLSPERPQRRFVPWLIAVTIFVVILCLVPTAEKPDTSPAPAKPSKIEPKVVTEIIPPTVPPNAQKAVPLPPVRVDKFESEQALIELTRVAIRENMARPGTNTVELQCVLHERSGDKAIIGSLTKAGFKKVLTEQGAVAGAAPFTAIVDKRIARERKAFFAIVMEVPDNSQWLRRVEASATVVRETARDSASWILPWNRKERFRTSAGIKWELNTFRPEGKRTLVWMTAHIDKGAAPEPHYWAKNFIQRRLKFQDDSETPLPDKMNGGLPGDFTWVDSMDFEGKTPTEIKVDYVSAIRMDEIPFVFENIELKRQEDTPPPPGKPPAPDEPF